MSKSPYNLTKIPVASLGNVADRVLSATDTAAIEDVGKSDVYAALKAKAAAFTNGIKKRLYSKLTSEMVHLDKSRDDTFRHMFDYVSSLVGSPVEAMHAPAAQVGEVLKRYSNVASQPMGEESKLIRKLVADLNAPALAAAVTAINLNPWINMLAAANNQFEDTVLKRNDDNVAIHEVQSATRQRSELEKALRDFLEYIHALVVVNKTDALVLLEKTLIENIAAATKPLLRDKPKSKEPKGGASDIDLSSMM